MAERQEQQKKLPRGNGQYILSFIGFSPVENPQIMLYVAVDSPNVESQSTSGAGALLFHAIMEDLLPYMNVYQSSDEDVTYNGIDEPISSPFEGSVEESTNEDGTSEAGSSTEEGSSSEESTAEGDTTEENSTEADSTAESDTTEVSSEDTTEDTTEPKVQDE